ncbi:MAG: hypothetical protein HC898_07115 [Phycisphaerales bacterium]|nr:hypothetical protein [Phycisphaerales bacterium]
MIRAEEDKPGRLKVVVSLEKPPVAVAYDVFAQSGNQRSKIGSVNIRPGGQTQWHIEGDFDLGQADKVDIELVPSMETALHSVDVFDYWGESMLFMDVPVKRLATTTTQTTP